MKKLRLESLAPWFVWSLWVVALTAMLALAASYTVNIPWADEWDYAPVIGGTRPASLEFFWAQHNEHRVPLPKLIWLLSLRLSDYDFRVLSFLHILGFAALSGALIVYAKLLRGRTSYADAFFPLLVLNPAHYQNLLWAWQVAFILPVILVGVLLLMIIRSVMAGPSLSWRTVALACICLVLLPLCGAVGLIFVPALSLWWTYLALSHWRSEDLSFRHKGLLLLVTNLAVLVLVIIYLHGLRRPVQILPTPGLQASLRTTLEFLTGSFGYHTGLAWPALGWAMLILIGVTMAVALLALWRSPQMRLPAAGFLLFLGAAAVLAFGVGWGRAGMGTGAGLQPRYVTLMVPALACVYFVWQCASPAISRLMQILLFTLASISLPISAREALEFRRFRTQQMEAFKTDLLSGMPASLLVRRHIAFLDHFAEAPEEGAEAMRLLQRTGVEVFRSLNGYTR
jgi:hypothetical protein